MSDEHDTPHGGYLDRVNAELSSSLRRCRTIVDDYRNRLAANSNEPVPASGVGMPPPDLDEA